MNIAVCDDRAEERAAVRKALHSIFIQRGEPVRVTEYGSGEALLLDMESGCESFDVLFLDIVMDGISGVDVAYRLRADGSRVDMVFLSSSPDYAMESYDVEAAGYLVKPLDPVRLDKVIDKITAPTTRRRMEINVHGHYQYVFVDEIVWVESQKNNVIYHLRDHTQIECRNKLDQVESSIDQRNFLRCHQSYLVNLCYVRRVDDSFHLSDGSKVPIRVRSRKQVVETYHNWFLSQY